MACRYNAAGYENADICACAPTSLRLVPCNPAPCACCLMGKIIIQQAGVPRSAHQPHDVSCVEEPSSTGAGARQVDVRECAVPGRQLQGHGQPEVDLQEPLHIAQLPDSGAAAPSAKPCGRQEASSVLHAF